MNIYKILFVVAALCSMLATTITNAVVKDGYLTIGLNNDTANNNYVSFSTSTTTPAITTAKGFDISMYCFIARHIGLSPRFVALTDESALIAALAAGEIDCYGGASFSLATEDDGVVTVDKYGVATDLVYNTYGNSAGTKVLSVVPNGIVFAAIDTVQADLPCSLMKQVELAVNLSVSSGAYACYAAKNNANIEDAAVLVGQLIVPTPFFSSVYGTIPAPVFATPTLGCTECTASLVRTSCLVDYLLLTKGCSAVVTGYVVPS